MTAASRSRIAKSPLLSSTRVSSPCRENIIPVPMGTFYTQRGAGVTDYHLRKDILLQPRGSKETAATTSIASHG